VEAERGKLAEQRRGSPVAPVTPARYSISDRSRISAPPAPAPDAPWSRKPWRRRRCRRRNAGCDRAADAVEQNS